MNTNISQALSSLNNMEEKFEKTMESFESRFLTATSTITLNQLAKDYQAFKSFVRDTLIMIKNQIISLITVTDDMENRSRKKFLLFRGVKENPAENTSMVLCNIGTESLKLQIKPEDIQFSYRLGTQNANVDKPRPILVKFRSLDLRTQVWRSKRELKGTPISVAEFLTAIRRRVYMEGRRIYGINNCWSQEGQIFIKLKDGSKRRILSENHLKDIVEEFPPEADDTPPVPSENQNKKLRTARHVKPKH